MIHLTYSNRLECLVDALTNHRAACDGDQIFAKTHIIVPNRNIATYVRFAVARRAGIAVNLEFHFLKNYLSEIVERSGNIQFMSTAVMQGLLLGAMTDESFLADARLTPIRDYIHPDGGDPEERCIRQFQLAQQLSALYEEYILSRPGMLERWSSGQATMTDPVHQHHERWQMTLWRKLFGQDGRLQRLFRASGKNWLGFGKMFESLSRKDMDLPCAIHVFGFSYIAHTFQRILHLLSQYTQLFIYAVNPCMEFWEDVSTTREAETLRNRIRQGIPRQQDFDCEDEDPFGLMHEDDTPALRLWGRPGRENIRILNEMTDCDFVSYFVSPLEDGATLLHQIQHDILVRAPQPEKPSCPIDPGRDKSLAILECPSIHREAEIIANTIWSVIMDDEAQAATDRAYQSIRFTDIAIVIADVNQLDAYQAHLASAFREAHHIPHSISNIAPSSNTICEAIQLLLSLPSGRFTRREMLAILTHPCLSARFQDLDTDEWIRWCDQVMIVHGASHEDHGDSYIEKDLFNWDQGIKRLILGAFMSNPPGREPTAFTLRDHAYMPCEVPESSIPNVAKFALLVRAMIADAKSVQHRKMSLRDWSAHFINMVHTYIAPSNDAEQHDFAGCLESLEKLREMSIEDRVFPYAMAREAALACLNAMDVSRGQYLADGVTVSSFLPMRPVPFRVIFIAGMGENGFPSGEHRNPLDLRLAKRLAGDVSPRERDKYMFLETLISARDKLYLSYVARDAETGERMAPSTVLQEFREMLASCYTGEEGFRKIVQRHPLRRFDKQYAAEDGLPNASPIAAGEIRTLQEREAMKARLAMPQVHIDTRDIRDKLSREMQAWLHLSPLPDASTTPMPDTLEISVHQLIQFLEEPLQGWASICLRMHDVEEDDGFELEDEVFSMATPDRGRLLRHSFHAAMTMGQMDMMRRIHGKHIARMEMEGTAPTGMYQHAASDRHLRILESWKDASTQYGGFPDHRYQIVHFGRAGGHLPPQQLLAPLSINVMHAPNKTTRPVRIRITGSTQLVSLSLPGSLVLLTGKHRYRSHILRGFLDHVLVSAAGLCRSDRWIITSAYGSHKANQAVCLTAFDQQGSMNYLQRMIDLLLAYSHDYRFDIETAFRIRTAGEAHVERILADETAFRENSYGPVRRSGEYPVADAASALRLYHTLYAPMFQRLPDNQNRR